MTLALPKVSTGCPLLFKVHQPLWSSALIALAQPSSSDLERKQWWALPYSHPSTHSSSTRFVGCHHRQAGVSCPPLLQYWITCKSVQFWLRVLVSEFARLVGQDHFPSVELQCFAFRKQAEALKKKKPSMTPWSLQLSSCLAWQCSQCWTVMVLGGIVYKSPRTALPYVLWSQSMDLTCAFLRTWMQALSLTALLPVNQSWRVSHSPACCLQFVMCQLSIQVRMGAYLFVLIYSRK